MVQIKNGQQQHKTQSSQFGAITNRDAHHQNWTENILQDLQEAELETDQRDEHESQQNAAGELHNVLRLVLAQRWYASEQTASFDAWLGQNEEQSSDESEIAQQELYVPENGVGNGLENDDEEESAASDLNAISEDDEQTAAQLADQIDQHKKGGKELLWEQEIRC